MIHFCKCIKYQYSDTILNQVSVSVSRYNLEVSYPTLIMEISFSRYMKDLGRLTSEELTAIFSRSYRTDDDKRSFVEMLKEFKDASEALEAHEYVKKTKSKPKTRATKKENYT